MKFSVLNRFSKIRLSWMSSRFATQNRKLNAANLKRLTVLYSSVSTLVLQLQRLVLLIKTAVLSGTSMHTIRVTRLSLQFRFLKTFMQNFLKMYILPAPFLPVTGKHFSRQPLV